MKNYSIVFCFVCISCILVFTQCSENKREPQTVEAAPPQATNFGGYASQEEWGQHLVTIGGCNDCHTPKKMTDHGPDFDSALLLSGHPAQSPPHPDVNRKEMEMKGLIVTNDLTVWAGPWGVSYTANLTSDSTGIGNWKEEQFIYALRYGKLKGLPGSRSLLPPMPWNATKEMTDGELKAVFAFLKATKPIHNIVPAPLPPIAAVH
ncbi:diheme cytochrome c-553 [Agriterribacter sp.]|uniref:diheme cytochrome c-553 n=1 Tax=Agriterribacter sp. TaxID=2821509 RepID=UPI002BD05B63|nr:diheme cytochrome c-553 [Agriterribacter sp.]HTN09278.1 hypothetical protein [Agriterribacter sp.]